MAEKELEKTKRKPGKEGEGGPQEESEGGGPGDLKKEGDEFEKEGESIKRDIEETRKKLKQRKADIEKDDTEVRIKHRQSGGE